MWLSPSGLYAFGFYPESNGYRIGIFLAGIAQKTVVWTANRDDAVVFGNATLEFDDDGRIILQVTQKDPDPLIVAQSASFASMLDSGNFVLYGSNEKIVWQSFGHPTDTIVSGQTLSAGMSLRSSLSETDHSEGMFSLVMQNDGNLVQYPTNIPKTITSAYWASNTNGAGGNVKLNLDNDGHLYLLDSKGSNIYNLAYGKSSVEKTIYLMRIDADGIFRLYSLLDSNGNWSTSWSSLDDKCKPKGICGLNAYCVYIDNQVDCRCLPGFYFVNPSNKSSECYRNFDPNKCKSNDRVTKYTFEMLTNTIWEDNSYSSLELLKQDDCEKACLEDCNCEAALFRYNQCKKQGLPLRFGRRSQSDPNVVLIKVGTSTVSPAREGFAPKKPKRVIDMLILGISISIGSSALIILAIAGVFIYRNNAKAHKRVEVGLSENVVPRCFTYDELVIATNGFKEELGKGSYGTVYKGKISNMKIIAVKRLDKVLDEGEREFQTEMNIIGRTHHRNLVKLLGYCVDGPNRLLVYEYMSRGSLARILSTPENTPSWDERTTIALDIARGLLYLHEECDTSIIHCDVKPHNILMDELGNTKICDFGLAKLLKVDQTNTYTAVRGTRGYVAPEWYRKLPVTVKVDVYSFGIVLFEIICCRKGIDISLPEEQVVLEQWVYDCFKIGKLHILVDDEEVDVRKLERIIKVGLWCIQDEPWLRPSMKKVLLMLEGTVDIPVPPNPSSFPRAI